MKIDRDWFIEKIGEAGYTQEQFANDVLKIDRTNLFRILNRTRELKDSEIHLMAKELKVSYDEIFKRLGYTKI